MKNALPIYPTFKNIEADDMGFFREYCIKYPSYSDFNILSLLSWGAGKDNQYTLINENLVIRIVDYVGEGHLYSILGRDKVDESIDILLEKYGTLSLVPESTVSEIQNPVDYKISEDRDNFDYILSTESIKNLGGRKFKHLREDVHKFKKICSEYSFKILDPRSINVKDELLAITNNWAVNKKFSEDKIKEEAERLKTFFKYSENSKLIYAGLFIEGNLEACILNEVLNTDLVMSHYGFSGKKHELSSYMMEYEMACYLNSKGYKFQNQQQDSGLEGLRRAKMFYNPAYFLKKYTIARK